MLGRKYRAKYQLTRQDGDTTRSEQATEKWILDEASDLFHAFISYVDVGGVKIPHRGYEGRRDFIRTRLPRRCHDFLLRTNLEDR